MSTERDELDPKVEAVARALFIEAHWQDTITEHDNDLKPREEYDHRAGRQWDNGHAGWSKYQMYPRLAKTALASIQAQGESA